MLQPGALINQRYQIVRQVGQGGMGAVYEAVDTRLGHHVAIKQTLITDPQYVHAFEREARLLAHLKHAHLPRVTDHFSDADGQFLVMDFILGDDLAALFQQRGGPFPLAQVLPWADQLLDALTYLHSQNPPVLHRDVKPQNLKQTPDGTLILLDFGLAKGALWQTRLTGGGSIAGYTPAYAPLEQIQGTGTDVRSDLYAVGATLYHLLVGTPPPDALTRAANLLSQQPDPLRPPHECNPALPQAVSAALVQAMSTNPNARPESAAALRTLLRRVPQSPPPPLSVAPTQVIRPPTQAAQPRPEQPPFAVGTPTLAVSPPKAAPAPTTPNLGTPPFVWIGVLLVVLLGVGAFIWGGGKGSHPTAAPTTAPAARPYATTVPAATAALVSATSAVTATTAPAATAARSSATAAPTTAPAARPYATTVPAATAARSSATTAPAALPAALVPEMVAVPAGSFLMGSSSADSQADDNERPQHPLTLPDYWIGKTEVTNAQFRPFVEGDGYNNPAYWTAAGWAWRQENKITQPSSWDAPPWNGPNYPVVGVSWFEAVAYCRWLSTQTGITFSLPSEAEWEKAARGSDGLIYPWGNTWDASLVNSSESGLQKTTPVGSYPKGASPYGALDMAGNVWEWCATQGGKTYPYQLEDEWQAAYLEAYVEARVLRGGASWNDRTVVRGAYRYDDYPRGRYFGLGLRVASRSAK